MVSIVRSDWSLSPQSHFLSAALRSQTLRRLQRPAWCLSWSLRPEPSSAESTSASARARSAAPCSTKVTHESRRVQFSARPGGAPLSHCVVMVTFTDFYRGKTVFKHWLPGVCYRDITFQLISEVTVSQTPLVSHSDITHSPLHHRTGTFIT